MTSELHKIQAKIKALEEQMENHMPIRRDEIFEILKSNNGIMIDDRILAGFAIYANTQKSSSFLKELYELGKGKVPKGKVPKGKIPKGKVPEGKILEANSSESRSAKDKGCTGGVISQDEASSGAYPSPGSNDQNIEASNVTNKIPGDTKEKAAING